MTTQTAQALQYNSDDRTITTVDEAAMVIATIDGAVSDETAAQDGRLLAAAPALLDALEVLLRGIEEYHRADRAARGVSDTEPDTTSPYFGLGNARVAIAQARGQANAV